MRVTATRLAVIGARGRMGARVCALARGDGRFALAAAVDTGTDPAAAAPTPLDAVIDFSSDAGTVTAVGLALAHRAALLVGTTGLSPATHRRLDQAAADIPLLIAANTALGVAVLTHLAGRAAELLGPAYRIDIDETHHAGKKDAPSGTALRLARALSERAGRDIAADRIVSRRVGDVIGEHVIRFTGPGEHLTMTHVADDRDLFAHGALRAVLWLRQQQPGRYSMEQALGLERGQSDGEGMRL